ncbi:DUF1284 domain-containing protein [Rhizobium oryziradicis]|uniref:2Fe-2S ferredoxin n=1 Tax=Rhizobium oryziradicis TaxID=1867956 RepID=A0A1Q8ZU72_9HYPH|nr:DUF1284 domain-containing protein [Rhizobium oryziradicis]OLP45603.1 2Fe-2S ferredoxin [Rhizobium oryziradicis]
MTVRLRPHHLLCMLTFVGKGYTPDFVENYHAVAKRLSAGEAIMIVEGPDDLCQPLTHAADAHCFGESVNGRDRQAASAVSALLQQPVAPDTMIVPDAALLARLRQAFSDGSVRRGCSGCEWSGLCDGVASSGYAEALIVSCE